MLLLLETKAKLSGKDQISDTHGLNVFSQPLYFCALVKSSQFVGYEHFQAKHANCHSTKTTVLIPVKFYTSIKTIKNSSLVIQIYCTSTMAYDYFRIRWRGPLLSCRILCRLVKPLMRYCICQFFYSYRRMPSWMCNISGCG